MGNDNDNLWFKGEVVRNVYKSGDFKIYAMEVDRYKYPFLEFNSFGNISILGDLPELSTGVEYEIEAKREDGKYGASYRVRSIRRNQPLTRDGVRSFLEEITSVDRAYVLSEAYPDIIERVKQNRLDDIDLNILPGIGEKSFNIIVDKITENFYLSDIVAEFNGVLSFTVVRKLYEQYDSVDMVRSKLLDKPYKTLTDVPGIGFKKADAMIITMQDEGILDFEYDIRTSEDRCYACMMYLLDQNENDGNTKMDIVELKHQVDELAPECTRMFVHAINTPDIYYSKLNREVAKKYTHDVEELIANKVINNLDRDDNKWDCDTEKYRNVGEFELSDEQLSVLDMVCNVPICILNGSAGSGKTSSMHALINMLDNVDKSYKLMSPTGKAAKLLSEVTGRPAQTIHRGLGYNPTGVWGFNCDNPLDVDVIIVDEVSMVDVSLFSRLIEAIDFSGTKLLMIGDNAQLPSVGCGNILHDFMTSGLIPTVTLSKIFRYGEGGMLKVATDIRMCKPYMNASMRGKVTGFGKNSDYTFIDVEQKDIAKQVVGIYKKLLNGGCSINDVQVITAKNIGEYGTDKYNKLLQQVANPNCGNNEFFKQGETYYYVGDLVMQCSNNYHAKTSELVMEPEDIEFFRENKEIQWPDNFVANGESGVVLNVDKDFIDIDFGNNIVVRYNHTDAQAIKLGYAITTHKSQGSGFDNVILITAKADTYTLNSNLLYVGCTRSKKRCFHVGSIDTVNKVIKKKENMSRKTFMQQMLRDFWMLKNNDNEDENDEE